VEAATETLSEPLTTGEEPLTVEVVHAQHGEFVWCTLQRFGIPPQDLEDVFQEVFLTVHRRLHTFNGTSQMTTWLFAICLRVASFWRRRAFRRRETLSDELAEHAGAATGPEELLEGQQRRARLQAVLDAMDLDKRAVLVMFELEEMSTQQIAALLGVPVGTVHSRLHAARKQFHAAMLRLDARRRAGGGMP
jgi:RNA polymerase sigma-70 factor (ECF subfamily)